MKTTSFPFTRAYDAFYEIVKEYSTGGSSVLEIGGGAYPSLSSRKDVKYSIVDPDEEELSKSPDDIIKIYGSVQDLNTNSRYTLIISKMVLEHIENPETFHTKVLDLLSEDGKVIHFFACRYSVPAIVNRFLSERIGDFILRFLRNRTLTEHPKYEAYYKKTLGHSMDQLRYFEKLGYNIEKYNSYLGHNYCDKIPVLKELENMYNKVLTTLGINKLATVALIVLSKSD